MQDASLYILCLHIVRQKHKSLCTSWQSPTRQRERESERESLLMASLAVCVSAIICLALTQVCTHTLMVSLTHRQKQTHHAKYRPMSALTKSTTPLLKDACRLHRWVSNCMLTRSVMQIRNNLRSDPKRVTLMGFTNTHTHSHTYKSNLQMDLKWCPASILFIPAHIQPHTQVINRAH